MKKRGFSLLELMVALAITSIVAGMMIAGITALRSTWEWQVEASKPINRLRTAMQIIEADFHNLSPRPIRNELREVEGAVFRDIRTDRYVVQFTRGGIANPGHAKRATMQRVAYQVKDKQLLRLTWPHLDRSDGRPPREQVLLVDVEAINIRFLKADNQWTKEWPPGPTRSNQQISPTVLPKATELLLTVSRFGEVRRVFSGVLP